MGGHRKRGGGVSDYHQKKISEMTDGELRAYRRELERAALTGHCANPNASQVSAELIADWNADMATEIIKRERQVEGGAE